MYTCTHPSIHNTVHSLKRNRLSRDINNHLINLISCVTLKKLAMSRLDLRSKCSLLSFSGKNQFPQQALYIEYLCIASTLFFPWNIKWSWISESKQASDKSPYQLADSSVTAKAHTCSISYRSLNLIRIRYWSVWVLILLFILNFALTYNISLHSLKGITMPVLRNHQGYIQSNAPSRFSTDILWSIIPLCCSHLFMLSDSIPS